MAGPAVVARPLPPGVVIRPATADDIPQLQQFRCSRPGEHWTVAPELIVQLTVPQLVLDGEELVLVAELSNQVVGVIAVTRDPHDLDVATSLVLAVVVEHQRRYIGVNLKSAAISFWQVRGVSSVWSEVDEENEPMRACNELFEAETAPGIDQPDLLLTAVRLPDTGS